MAEKFDQWAILEIMGHQRYAGRVTEQAIGGASFVRIDVPEFEGKPGFTKLFGSGSIYGITIVSEEIAIMTAKSLGRQPINVWDLPHDLQARIRQPAIAGPDDDEEYDDD